MLYATSADPTAYVNASERVSMKYEAIVKARRRFGDAISYVHRLEAANSMDVEEMHRAWYGFIVALNAIMEIMRTSSKLDPRARQAVGRKIKFIMADPLLHYLFQARACDYHGTKNSVGLISGETDLSYVGQGSFTAHSVDGLQSLHQGIMVLEGPTTEVGATFNFELELKPLVDEKYGNYFAVPDTHLGKLLLDTNAVKCANLAIQFYALWLDECEALVS